MKWLKALKCIPDIFEFRIWVLFLRSSGFIFLLMNIYAFANNNS